MVRAVNAGVCANILAHTRESPDFSRAKKMPPTFSPQTPSSPHDKHFVSGNRANKPGPMQSREAATKQEKTHQ
jgi:hypothetical protein